MFKRILVAYDGSESAVKAFDRSLRLISSLTSELAIIAVVPASDFALETNAQAIRDDAQDQFKGQFTTLQRRARMSGIEPKLMLRVGSPAREIIQAAAEWRADLIITGRRGNGFLQRWTFGSVSHQVIADARCPVLVMQ